jgi:glutamine synthetase
MLPQGLGQALDALERDKEIGDLLGTPFVEAFLAYKRDELQRFQSAVTDWEFREYAHHL